MRYVIAFLFAATLRAGVCTPGDGLPRHDFQFFAGYSPWTATFIGTAEHRRFVAAGFTYGYRCWIWRSFSLSYSPTAMPAAILLQPTEILVDIHGVERVSHSHAVYGFAAAPIGFTVEFLPGERVYPFLETNEGVIASTQPIPIYEPNATGLNFFFDIGAGARWNVSERGAVALGYRFLHISNAGTTNFNPGLDNNIFYVGYSFLR
jgi:hypothetical protein